ncbi:MAG: sugar ABC transporter permease [Chloroflexota bacterium]
MALLLSPFVIGSAVLVVLPALVTVALAFARYDGMRPPVFTGLTNLRLLAADPQVPLALLNTLVVVLVMVPLRVAGALLLALLLQRPGPGVGTARAAVYLPAVIPDVAYALVWVWVFNPLFGPVNLALGAVGLPQPGWLADSATAKVPFIVMAVFGLGEGFVVLLAARKGVPVVLEEAAAIDGAGRLARFRWVLLPALVPWLVLLSIRDVILGFQWTLGPAAIMTGGGPARSTLFVPQLIVEEAFDRFRYGTGSALMVVSALLAGLLIAGIWVVARARGFRDAV